MKPGFAYEGGGRVNTTPQINDRSVRLVAKRIEEPEFELVESFNKSMFATTGPTSRLVFKPMGAALHRGGFVALHATSSEETNRGNPLQ